MVDYMDVVQARERVQQYLTPTMLEPAPGLPGRVWLKLENTNRTHSFKIRGALNAVLSLDDAARERGIITASSGNHAQGIAYAAHLTGVKAQVLMPSHTPRRKVNGVKNLGAEAVLFGLNYDETEAEAHRRAREDDLTYVSPYNDARVIAGNGTIGLEILEDLPNVRRVIVCAGGGGLVSGIALAIKTHNPQVEVIGVNALAAPALYNLRNGTDYPQEWDTLAEALSGDIEAGSLTLDITHRYMDRAVLVEEYAIEEAIRWLVDVQGWLVEGGGAVGVAAVRSGEIALDEQPTVIVISGGNIDGETLRRVLLAED